MEVMRLRPLTDIMAVAPPPNWRLSLSARLYRLLQLTVAILVHPAASHRGTTTAEPGKRLLAQKHSANPMRTPGTSVPGVFEHHGQVRLGMMRHMFVIIDGSRTMEDQDLKPNRLTCTLKLLEYFVDEYFDQNPISQIGLLITRNKRAEKLTELAGNPRQHITALKKAVDMTCSGEPSLYNSLNLALQTLKHMPGHTSREILVIFSSLTTCDPSNIYDIIKSLKASKIRVSVIGLSAEVRVCTVLTRETGGAYHVILDESHYKELLLHHVCPPPASTSSECSLIRMGFPQHTMGSISDQDAKPSFSMAHLDSNSEPGLTLGGYFCPQCKAKYSELPVECKVCRLTLVSAPHLARSYHHLFPLDAFKEMSLAEYEGERYCRGCDGELKDQQVSILF
ncbi:general transcription factor IIH subunit 2 isoform X3 [Ranitomeya variabilis]|uniref:general transcription factor IIH subunit 2 isoform X3 n=1 Tax=Ranitomeya variabilis TaxID=490064 RepID=UPI0040577B5F